MALIEKTDSNCNIILVEDDVFESPEYKKYRNKPTNVTPKKRKRK